MRQAAAGPEPTQAQGWLRAGLHTAVGSEAAGSFGPSPPRLGLGQPLPQRHLELGGSVEPIRSPAFERACFHQLRFLGRL